jgi:hypothetical protein
MIWPWGKPRGLFAFTDLATPVPTLRLILPVFFKLLGYIHCLDHWTGRRHQVTTATLTVGLSIQKPVRETSRC